MLKINCLKKYYGNRLLLDIDQLAIHPGQKIGVVGENGAGKTTLLKIIAGEDQEYAGDIKFSGNLAWIKQADFKDVSKYSGGEEARKFIAKALNQRAALLLID